MENQHRIRRIGEATERKIALMRRSDTETIARYGTRATTKVSLAETPRDDEKPE